MSFFVDLTEKIKISHAVILVALLPITVTVFFALRSILDELSLEKQTEKLYRLVELSIQLNDLVHEQQKERGATSGFLGSSGTDFHKELITQRRKTDLKLNSLLEYLKIFDRAEFGEGFQKNIELVLSQTEYLEQIRRDTDRMNISAKDTFDFILN